MDARREQFLQNVTHTWDEAAFYQDAFSFVDRSAPAKKPGLDALLLNEYDQLSQDVELSHLQDACSVRNVLKARELAHLLIDAKGELNLHLLNPSIRAIEQSLYSLGPERQFDAMRQRHILKVLRLIEKDKNLVWLLKKIGRPHAHRFADQIIRATMRLPEHEMVTDAEARRATLAAWFTYLRQNVGSCFATAPAILIHDEQPEQFLTDLNDLLNTGRLKRTYGGVEYSVPMSVSWGAGDLRRMLQIDTFADQEQNPFWQSPALLSALEAAGLIKGPEKADQAKKLLLGLIQKASRHTPLLILSIGDLLKNLVLRHYHLTQADLEEFENRPRAMIQSNLLIQTPQTGSKMGGKGQAVAQFHLALEAAEQAFKSYSDNALLKSWEFTLASFSENKAGFTRWNLYSSLGLASQEPGGIGHVLFQKIKEKLDYENQQLEEMELEHEQIYAHIKYLETRMRGASESENQWLKAEYQTRRNEFYTFEEMRSQKRYRAQKFSNLYNTLVQIYDYLFPQYFQEIYDADMSEVATGPFDDSPAGFRLIYKHGRSNTAQWSRVKNAQEFVENLANFFIVTENEISATAELEGFEQDFGEIVTAIVTHVRSHEFLETSFYRIARAHQVRPVKDPLENLDKIEKKPWAYTSGGTMETLVSTYYRREQKPSEAARWVENPMELLVFFLDVMKQMPVQLSDDYRKNPHKRMLMNSPTHAFLFQPGLSPFKIGWENDAFTYTYVRDTLVKPMQNFVENQFLHEDMLEKLILDLAEKVPTDYKHYFLKIFQRFYGSMRPYEFREQVLETISRERGLQIRQRGVLSGEAIDQVLYENLPLFTTAEMRGKVEELLIHLNGKLPKEGKIDIADALTILDQLPAPLSNQIVGAKQLQDLVKALILLQRNQTSFKTEYHCYVAESAQALGFSYPKPLIFADTNWVKDYFAFLVNPGTNALDFWRVDYLGIRGAPMAVWQEWLNGSRKDISWSVYHRPFEYVR